MKSTMCVLALLTTQWVCAQQFNEKIVKEYTFEKKSADNTVMIANINGHVNVVGYDGDKVMLEVNRSLTAKTDARLEKAKQEIQLGVVDLADTLIFYVQDGGCNQFGRNVRRNKHNEWDKRGWGYNWCCNQNGNGNCNNGCNKESYDYRMDFTLKVPAGVHLNVSTINNGNIAVENIRGVVDANNINGSIKLSNLVREAEATTINGDVDIDYTSNPVKDCRFYSLNGDINALFRKGLAASLSFESFNGSFYTNISSIESLPTQVEKSNKGKGIAYKVNASRYKIGNGGAAYLDFETFNGNVYLKEKSN
jgi:hypothetical protein